MAPSACVYTATLKEGLMLIHSYLFSLMFPGERYKYNGRGVSIEEYDCLHARVGKVKLFVFV